MYHVRPGRFYYQVSERNIVAFRGPFARQRFDNQMKCLSKHVATVGFNRTFPLSSLDLALTYGAELVSESEWSRAWSVIVEESFRLSTRLLQGTVPRLKRRFAS